MAKTDIKLYATDPVGKQTTATISDVNPDATNAQLKTLGQMLNQFTENVYDSTYRINTIHCDSEAGGGQQTPTFTLSTTSISYATFVSTLNNTSSYDIVVTYDGDGAIFANVTGDSGYLLGSSPLFVNNSGTKYFMLYGMRAASLPATISGDIVITYRTEATDTYKSVEATFTITA